MTWSTGHVGVGVQNWALTVPYLHACSTRTRSDSRANYRACQSSSCDSSQRALDGLKHSTYVSAWLTPAMHIGSVVYFPLHVRSRALHSRSRSNDLSVAAPRSVQNVNTRDSRSKVSWVPVHIFGPIQACSDIFRLDGTRFTFTSHLVIRQGSDFGGFVLLRGCVSLAAVVAFAQDCRVKVSPVNFTTYPTRCPVSATFRKYVAQYSEPTRSQVKSSNGKAEVVCCRERGQDWIKSLQDRGVGPV